MDKYEKPPFNNSSIIRRSLDGTIVDAQGRPLVTKGSRFIARLNSYILTRNNNEKLNQLETGNLIRARADLSHAWKAGGSSRHLKPLRQRVRELNENRKTQARKAYYAEQDRIDILKVIRDDYVDNKTGYHQAAIETAQAEGVPLELGEQFPVKEVYLPIQLPVYDPDEHDR